MTGLDSQIATALKGPRFALIGAGQLGEMTLGMWPGVLPKPEFFVDTVKSGTLAGLPIFGLKDHQAVDDVVYLLSAFKLPTRDVKAIFEKLGQSVILTVYDLFEETTPDWFSNGWRNLQPEEAIVSRLDTLQQYYADDASVKAVNAAISWRYHRVLADDYPVGPESAKYDLALFGRANMHYDVVYDCGSFDLGLQHYLEKCGITFDRYFAIEPDPQAVKTCLQTQANLPDPVRQKTEILEAAISDKSVACRFLASGLLSARLLDADAPLHTVEFSIKTTTLDTLSDPETNAQKSILLKLHIEGEELPALLGAEHLIDNNRCDILVNLSHNEKQFLDVPAFISKFGKHDIFLRSHSLFGEGLTLFAKYRH